MSQTVNSTNNQFYGKILLKKGSKLKSFFLPHENSKADLGSPTKRFDKIYANNIPGHAARNNGITTGTWTPSFDWRDSDGRPPRVTPSSQIIEAGYQKIGDRVWCFCVFSIRFSESSRYISPLGGLPFEIYQRGAYLTGSFNRPTDKSSSGEDQALNDGAISNVFNYNSSQMNVSIKDSDKVEEGKYVLPLFVNPGDTTRRSVISYYEGQTRRSKNSFIYARLYPQNVTRYFYAQFNYRTRS